MGWMTKAAGWAGIAAGGWYASTLPLPDQLRLLALAGAVGLWLLWRVTLDAFTDADRKFFELSQRAERAEERASELLFRVAELEAQLRPQTSREDW